VVATGSLTIPLMKKVGYHKKTAGAIEAAASTGGQIMPPIMGAGAFIMAEITGIPYQEIAIAAIIPAILYFASIYFMVDFEAAKLGMRGMREDELPKFKEMARKVFLFLPIMILIAALFMGYSVIRAGTLATVAAVVVSWAMPEHFALRGGGRWTIQRLLVLAIAALSIGLFLLYLLTPASEPGAPAPPSIATLSLIASLVVVVTFLYISYREFTGGTEIGLGIKGMLRALELAGVMSIQIIAVCACAGIIVGVISLTGVGARFSAVLLDLAGRQPASGAVLRHVHRDPARHGHAHHGGLRGGGLGRGAGPRATGHPDADGAFLRLLLRRGLGHHAARGAGQLRGRRHLGREPDGDLGRLLQDRHRGLHRALHVLLQQRDPDGGQLVRGHPRRHHRGLRGVPAERGRAGLVHGRARGVVPARGLIAAALCMIEGGLDRPDRRRAAVGIYFMQKVFHPRPDATIPVRGAD
jgi:TRAP-type C4-dicarboxylate transport system permease large subunit